mmetsp:Transcript_19387/g.32601  ORF Transcript_19387/g.32601 Transcript_19387/m.32601 type:complete len:109 (-) Transcript_19387:4-330(-)
MQLEATTLDFYQLPYDHHQGFAAGDVVAVVVVDAAVAAVGEVVVDVAAGADDAVAAHDDAATLADALWLHSEHHETSHSPDLPSLRPFLLASMFVMKVKFVFEESEKV